MLGFEPKFGFGAQISRAFLGNGRFAESKSGDWFDLPLSGEVGSCGQSSARRLTSAARVLVYFAAEIAEPAASTHTKHFGQRIITGVCFPPAGVNFVHQKVCPLLNRIPRDGQLRLAAMLQAGDGAAARDAALLVARSFRSFDVADRPAALLLLESPSAPASLPSSAQEVELAGVYASTGSSLSVRQRSVLMGILEGSTPGDPSRILYVEADKSGRDDIVQLVAGLTSTHLLAFSRFVIAAKGEDPVLTDPRTLPFLEQALADGIRGRVRVGLLRTVVRASAVAAYASSGPAVAGRSVDRMRRHSADAARRLAASAIAIAELSTASTELRVRILSDLRAAWSLESEPEVRLALAATIIGMISPPDALPRPSR